MERILEEDVKPVTIIYKQDARVEVWKVILVKTNQVLCMKKIFVDNITEATKMQEEFLIMAKTNHPNIVNLKAVSLGGRNRNITHISIFMDYFSEGDLDTLIQSRAKSNHFFQESEIFSYISQIVDACAYLQDLETAHRDIKPQNIFVCNEGRTLKIGDMGSAKKRDENDAISLAGTPLYLSPILREFYLTNRSDARVKHDMYKSDVFSVGLTFLYLASLESVKSLCTLENLKSLIEQRIINLSEHYPRIKQILMYMLLVEEELRPNFIQLKSFLSDVRIQEPAPPIKTLPNQNLCMKCRKEHNEDSIYILGDIVICIQCFNSIFSTSPEYYLCYNGITYKYPDPSNPEFKLCRWCKLCPHNGQSCLEYCLSEIGKIQSCSWICRACTDGKYICKNSSSLYVSCEQDHYFCGVCEHEFNHNSHKLCQNLYSTQLNIQ